MLVILGNSAQLNPFLLQKGFFFPLKTYHFKNALQSGDLSRKRRLAVLNRRFLRLLYGVIRYPLSVYPAHGEETPFISRAQISVNAHSLIKDGTVSFSVTVAFWG